MSPNSPKSSMRKTKIICTIGPASNSEAMLRRMIEAGMDVARLNFSHTGREEALQIIGTLKRLREQMSVPLGILLDTKGPEVRLYGYDQAIELEKETFIEIESYTGPDINTALTGKAHHYYTNLPAIHTLVKPDARVLLMDGYIEGVAVDIGHNRIRVKVLNSARLRRKAHLSIPHVDYPLEFLSQQDREDILLGVEQRIDYIALSFVRSFEDIYQVKKLIYDAAPESNIKIISKIENKASLDDLEDIIHHSDGIMVARGDLGVELPFEEVPIHQKRIIKQCYKAAKPVITATQMLETMIENRLPTRAEASDVANACYDMTSAVMLSGETTVGKWPARVVSTMDTIIRKAENAIDYREALLQGSNPVQARELTTVVTYNALTTAYHSKASAIIVLTKSGYSARMISRLRPGLPIYTFTYDKHVYHQLALNWGVFPYIIERTESLDLLIATAMGVMEEKGLMVHGELAVVVAGLPLGKQGTTNLIKVEALGKVRASGECINRRSAWGEVVHIHKPSDLQQKEIKEKILFLKNFDKAAIPAMKYARGLVMEDDDNRADLSVLALALNIPVLLNVHGVFEQVAEGRIVDISGENGLLIER